MSKHSFSTAARLRRLMRNEHGIAMPMVLAIFIVGFALVTAFMVAIVGSAQVGTTTRASVQAQAAAEAGIAAAQVELVAMAENDVNFCDEFSGITAASPAYEVTASCDNVENPTVITLVSSYTGTDGAKARIEAQLPVVGGTTTEIVEMQRSLVVEANSGGGGGGGSGEVLGTLQPIASEPGTKHTVVLPHGDFHCWSWNKKVISGDLFVLDGDVTIGDECRVEGNVSASGTVKVQDGYVGGDVNAAGTKASTIGGTATVVGTFSAAGTINRWGSYHVGTLKPNTAVAPPEIQHTWPEWQFNEAVWQAAGYTKGSATACNSNGTLVSEINSATTPKYFVCSGALNMWDPFTLSLKTDIAIVNTGGSSARINVQSADGGVHQLSLLTSDANIGSNSPSCWASTLNLHGGVNVSAPASMFIYTPCQLSLASGTLRGSLVTGQLHAYNSPNQLISSGIVVPEISLAVDEHGEFIEVTGPGVPKLKDGLQTLPTSQRNID